MYGVVNESIGRVHFTPRLTIGTFEGVLALESCAASRVTDVAMYASGQQIRPYASKPAKLTGVNLPGNISSHVDGRITVLRHIVLCHRVAA